MTITESSTTTPVTPETVEFVGMIGGRNSSEAKKLDGALFDPAFTVEFARAHEDADFDRVLIGHSSSSPDGLQVGAAVAAATERLGLLVAHRPGFVAPTMAARMFATLDTFSHGRVALHTITGGSDPEQRRDGDYQDKEARYRRSDEYLGILRRAWASSEPFDHDGEFYRFQDFGSEILPANPAGIPLYFGGSSEAAFRVGGRHADVFALWGEPLRETAEQIAAVDAGAAAAGRGRPGISVSFRPILGRTETEAWERAHSILDAIHAGGGKGFLQHDKMHPSEPHNVGSQRLLAAAEKGELHDRALWTPTAAAVGGGGNSTSLVGTPETVAAALVDYVELGATTLLIRGYDPLADTVDYGTELIPLVRQELAHRAATRRPSSTDVVPGASA